MKEIKTKKILMQFIQKNTNLEVVDMGSWFYAYYKSLDATKAIAFRADYDAVVCDNGEIHHLCGHDGHSAILAGFSIELEEIAPNADVYLVFQPGEEIGEGGKICSKLMEEKNISEIYGFHNIPGVEENIVILRENTFACASTGMEISIEGAPSHAAYPEQGKNPANIIANLILYMHKQIEKEHKGIVLGTVIGINLGSESYGVSAGKGVLRLTLRAEYPDEYGLLIKNITNFAKEESKVHNMECSIRFIEEFPATVNNAALVEKLKIMCEARGYRTIFAREPFRWSEDFGYYLEKTNGVFFGIGCGVKHVGLHTEQYEFNDVIIERVIEIYKEILCTSCIDRT